MSYRKYYCNVQLLQCICEVNMDMLLLAVIDVIKRFCYYDLLLFIL